MKKVENSRKISLLKLKKAIAAAGLAISLGMVAIPFTVHAEDEVLWEDDSSKDTNLTDAEEAKAKDILPAGQETTPVENTQPVVEQVNNPEETKTTETVNDGTVDTSKDTDPKDAVKNPYNGNDDDYFDEWTPDDDYHPYIDSPSEPEIKIPTPTPTPTPTPQPQQHGI